MKVINIITTPEIEILIIINEKKYNDYENKYKNRMKPSEYCKTKLNFKKCKSVRFLEEYFNDVDKLVESIKKYKCLRNIRKNENCLADILK